MKHTLSLGFTTLFLLFTPLNSGLSNPQSETRLISNTDNLNDNSIPRIIDWVTESGIKVFMYQVDSIPAIDVAIDIDSGSRWDPSGMEGLSAMTQSMVFKGLSRLNEQKEMSEEDILQFIAKMALVKSNMNDKDKTSLRFRFLSDNELQEPILSFIARILSFPKFDEGILEREKNIAISRLQDSLTKPQSIALRNLWKSMYPDHPYGRSATEESIGSITVDDLYAFHSKFWTPKRIKISIVGNIKLQGAKNLVEKISKPLSKRTVLDGLKIASKTPQVLPPVGVGGKSTLYIPHPAEQSHIWLGMPILARHETDDIFPMFVANHILGGSGFGSRLTREVREKRGLSYSVFSTFRLLQQKGPFFVGLQTGKKNTKLAVDVVTETLIEFLENGPNQEELDTAKKGLVGGFALRLDSNSKILENLAQIAFYNLPLDYLENWTTRINAVTLEDVNKVLKSKIDLGNTSLVVVGASQ